MSEPEQPRKVRLPLEWHVPETVVPRYATHIVVQAEEHEFVISFFETHMPIVLGSPEEHVAKLESLKSVRAECVARIVVASGRMADFVRVLQQQLEKREAQATRKAES